MPIPTFLSPRQVSLSPPATSASAASARAGGGTTGFTVLVQEQTNWCWSGVAISVERFYDKATTRTQCGLADTALQRSDCCGGGAGDASKCNRPWFLDRALRITGNLRVVRSGDLPFADVRSEVDAGTPVACRIGWHGGGGHFAVVTGWRVGATGTEYMDISDPIWLNQQIAYADFASAYHSGGDWTHSYLTTPATGGGALAKLFDDMDDSDMLGG